VSPTAPATILVNDRPQALAVGATVGALLRELELADRQGVAVAVNAVVVRRAEWAGRASAIR
jgi:thiamine biosynthesis protein ThiS